MRGSAGIITAHCFPLFLFALTSSFRAFLRSFCSSLDMTSPGTAPCPPTDFVSRAPPDRLTRRAGPGASSSFFLWNSEITSLPRNFRKTGKSGEKDQQHPFKNFRCAHLIEHTGIVISLPVMQWRTEALKPPSGPPFLDSTAHQALYRTRGRCMQEHTFLRGTGHQQQDHHVLERSSKSSPAEAGR